MITSFLFALDLLSVTDDTASSTFVIKEAQDSSKNTPCFTTATCNALTVNRSINVTINKHRYFYIKTTNTMYKETYRILMIIEIFEIAQQMSESVVNL